LNRIASRLVCPSAGWICVMPQQPLDYAVPNSAPSRHRNPVTWKQWLAIAVIILIVVWGAAVGFYICMAHALS
jgi:hypothetical protein